MTEFAKIWADFGLQGLIIGTLFACLYVMIRTQKEERQEWLSAYREHFKQYKEQCDRYDIRQQETNQVLQSLSNVIHGANNRYRGDKSWDNTN